MLALTSHPPTFLDGYPVLADAIRLFIIIIGFTLAMVAAKIGVRAATFGDWERAFGMLGYALIVVTPSITGLYRFGDPLLAPMTITYLAGLLAGVVAMFFRITLRWAWWERAADRRRAATRDRNSRRVARRPRHLPRRR